MTTNLEVLKAELEATRERVKVLEQAVEQQKYESQTPTQRLAVRLHSLFCKHNHTDGCGWLYEVHKGEHDWNGGEHVIWYRRAALLEVTCASDRISSDVVDTVLDVAAKVLTR